jgi:dTMP kinase
VSNTTTDPSESRSGLFIVFEGVEGAGKSTQIGRVAARLTNAGVPHRLVREPGGTAVGERIREVLLDPGLEMCAETELLLVLAARAEFVRRLIGPALEAGELVLSDRYELSTFAYQGAGRDLGLSRTRAWNEWATGGLKPDLTILLLVDPELGRGRQSGARDRLENERVEFHRTVAAAYERLAAEDETIVVVRAEGSPDETHERIWRELSRRWPRYFPGSQDGDGNFSPAGEFHEQDDDAAPRGGSSNDGGE